MYHNLACCLVGLCGRACCKTRVLSGGERWKARSTDGRNLCVFFWSRGAEVITVLVFVTPKGCCCIGYTAAGGLGLGFPSCVRIASVVTSCRRLAKEMPGTEASGPRHARTRLMSCHLIDQHALFVNQRYIPRFSRVKPAATILPYLGVHALNLNI